MREEIRKPENWLKMPKYGMDFYQDQVDIARGLVQAASKDALVIMTLYSPFMCAGDTVGKDVLVNQIREYPAAVKKAWKSLPKA